jgi:hypothetical protein
MKVDEVAEGLEACDTGRDRSLVAINLTLRVERPKPGVLAAQKGLADVASLASDLNAPGTGWKLGEGSYFRVLSVCTPASKGSEKVRKAA